MSTTHQVHTDVYKRQHYAQIRILVDGTHYIKGMAVYSDDLPDGVDVMFNLSLIHI